jgi:hypothetical protein
VTERKQGLAQLTSQRIGRFAYFSNGVTAQRIGSFTTTELSGHVTDLLLNQQPKQQTLRKKTKLKTLIAIALFAASIVGASAQVHVNGYYRKDGTPVREHWRSSPDGIESNNWSYRGR